MSFIREPKYIMRTILLLILIFTLHSGVAQTDSVAYTHDYEFKEGVYLNVTQFLTNSPIPRSSIISGVSKSQIDFISQSLEGKYMKYLDANGKEQQLECATAWGYSQNHSVFIHFNKSFNRVNVIGTLCHLVATVTTLSGMHDPMDYNYAINNTYDELRQFVFDTRTDQIHDFTVKNMVTLLASDPELSAEFAKLSKKKQGDSVFLYLRKFNQKHPLYLPAN